MADNLAVTPGSGASVATKDVGGNHNQRIIVGDLVVVTNALTRPADTTNYAAKDSLADSTTAPTLREFTNAARYAAGSGFIVGAFLMTDNADTNEWQNVAVRLWLFNTDTGLTVPNDNAAFTGPLWADRTKLVGFVDFPGFMIEGTGATALHAVTADLRVPFVLAATETSLWGMYEVLVAPVAVNSAQNFYCGLYIEQN